MGTQAELRAPRMDGALLGHSSEVLAELDSELSTLNAKRDEAFGSWGEPRT